MRPVLTNGTPTYQVPPTMVTYTAAIIAGLAANGVGPVAGNTFNTAAVTGVAAGLTFVNHGAAQWGNLLPVNKAFMKALINYFSENATMKYGNARGSLIDNYGQYCAYCGTPVQDTALAIEHCLPKAEFPSEMLNYTNFFLSCPSCNSYKGSNPTYVTSYQFAAANIANPPTYQDVLSGGMVRQVWPNSGMISWRGLPPYLYDVTNNLILVPATAENLANRQVSVVQNTVQANIAGYNQPITVAALVTISFSNPTEQLRENNFLNIVQLNAYQANVYSDRRVTNRTIAWLNVLLSLSNLQAFQAGSQNWLLMLQQIFITAKNAGFFEIWSWLFYLISPPNVQNSIYTYFRTASTNPNQQFYYFPGTNINDLPTQ